MYDEYSSARDGTIKQVARKGGEVKVVIMKKRFSANFVGITYVVTIRKHYKTGGFVFEEKKAYHFNGYVGHPQFEKIARNIIAAQVKKDMSIYSHLRGYSIVNITDI